MGSYLRTSDSVRQLFAQLIPATGASVPAADGVDTLTPGGEERTRCDGAFIGESGLGGMLNAVPGPASGTDGNVVGASFEGYVFLSTPIPQDSIFANPSC